MIDPVVILTIYSILFLYFIYKENRNTFIFIFYLLFKFLINA